MADLTANEHPFLRYVETVLTWVSRIVGVAILFVVGYWWTDLILSRFSATELLWPGLLPPLYCLGLILSWKFKLVGGVIASLAAAGFCLTFLFADGPGDYRFYLLCVLLALPGLLSVVAGILRHRAGTATRMTLSSLRSSVAVFFLFCFAVVGWKVLFGHSYVAGARGTRFFGRETLVQSDRNSDGQFDFERRYSWSDPFRWDESEGWTTGIPISERWDQDFDGKWDTWVVRGGNGIDGVPLLRYEVDLTSDSEPDWSFHLTICDKSARDKIKARRGF